MNKRAVVGVGLLGTAAIALAASAGAGRSVEAAEASVVRAAERSMAATYTVDAVHSGAIFRVRHAGVSPFHGRFNELSGSYTFDPADLSSASFSAEIPVASVDTNNENRDKHLRAADFFNARQYPVATFESTGVSATDEADVYEISGDLTLHGQTNPITAKLHWMGTGTFRGKNVSGFEATFEFKRSDFGMTTYLAEDGGESGGLGNTVRVTMFVEGVEGASE